MTTKPEPDAVFRLKVPYRDESSLAPPAAAQPEQHTPQSVATATPFPAEAITFETLQPEQVVGGNHLCGICSQNPSAYSYQQKSGLNGTQKLTERHGTCCAQCATTMIVDVAERAMRNYTACGCF